MKPGIEFRLQYQHNGALRLDAGQSLECSGCDSHGIMGFATRCGPGVPGVFVAVIRDFELCGFESLGQKVTNSR